MTANRSIAVIVLMWGLSCFASAAESASTALDDISIERTDGSLMKIPELVEIARKAILERYKDESLKNLQPNVVFSKDRRKPVVSIFVASGLGKDSYTVSFRDDLTVKDVSKAMAVDGSIGKKKR